MGQWIDCWKQCLDRLPLNGRLGQVVLESWHGAQVKEAEVEGDACGPGETSGAALAPEELALRFDANRELMEAARPNLDWADLALGHLSHLVYLIDRDGIVLHAAGNDPEKMAKLRLLPGADWSEASKGRNGAGTALAEDRPVVVVGPDQVSHPLDDCTWTGAPLHAPDGALIAAVGITTCAEEGTPDRLLLVVGLAFLIEQEIVRGREDERREPGPVPAVSRVEGLGRPELLEAIADPFWILDRQWRFVALNREAERHLGRTHEELLGRTPWDVEPSYLGSILERRFQEARETGAAVDFEWFCSPMGTWHAVHAQPFRFGLIIHSHDVTNRKRVEEKLRASEERHRLISDLTTDFTYMVGIGPDGAPTVVSASPGYFRILGSTLEELNARGWVGLVDPDDWPAAQESYRRLVAGHREEREVRVVTKDGAVRWIRYVSRPIWDETGTRVVRIVGAGQDVTDRRSAEEALKDADRRKDEFLAMLAHELRNPLAPIRNALHTIKADVAGTPTEPVRAMMERQVDRLARLIDDLLDVSRITRGKIVLRKEVVDLAESARRAIEKVGPALEQGRQRLTATLPDRPVLVEGDPVRLEQVFDNLLDNAIKYTGPGGTIELEVRREAGLASFRIRDTGIGIAADMLPHVFELFIQAERLLVQSQGGLGIGLSLVRRLVEIHGGTVAASSGGPGLGSEFIVRLPSLPEPSSAPPEPQPWPPAVSNAKPPPSSGPPPPHRRILVVDDNVDSARSMASILTRLWNQNVAVAYDAASALALADSFQPDVVLLDIGLPGPSGYELAQRLRDRPQFQTTLLVAMSGWGRDEDRRKSHEAGINHHLVKPVALADLELLLAGPEPAAPTTT